MYILTILGDENWVNTVDGSKQPFFNQIQL